MQVMNKSSIERDFKNFLVINSSGINKFDTINFSTQFKASIFLWKQQSAQFKSGYLEKRELEGQHIKHEPGPVCIRNESQMLPFLIQHLQHAVKTWRNLTLPHFHKHPLPNIPKPKSKINLNIQPQGGKIATHQPQETNIRLDWVNSGVHLRSHADQHQHHHSRQ